MPRHFLRQSDLSPSELNALLDRAVRMKPIRHSDDLTGRSLVMFFEKTSTRTRLSFEIGMTQLGGHAVYLDAESSQFSRGESVEDISRVVSRYADMLMARVYAHEMLERLAAVSSVPVINGLSDDEHPCQILADLLTIIERRGKVNGLKIAYVGDGRNNVTHSLLIGVAQLGGNLVVACPPQLAPEDRFVTEAERWAESSGGSVLVITDPTAAVRDADVIYTDVWVSMGRESDREARIEALLPYQVDDALVRLARHDFLFMHCLPAHIGEEVTEAVAYGSNSVIFDQAENRLHAQKALMTYLIEWSDGGH